MLEDAAIGTRAEGLHRTADQSSRPGLRRSCLRAKSTDAAGTTWTELGGPAARESVLPGLAECARGRGWRTAGFTDGGTMSRALGFGRGFQRVLRPCDDHGLGPLQARVARFRRFLRSGAQVTGNRVGDRDRVFLALSRHARLRSSRAARTCSISRLELPGSTREIRFRRGRSTRCRLPIWSSTTRCRSTNTAARPRF